MKIIKLALGSVLITFAGPSFAMQDCSPLIQDQVSKDFQARTNRNFDVSIKSMGSAGINYGGLRSIQVYSASLHEESGANLYIFVTTPKCTILRSTEVLNSDRF